MKNYPKLKILLPSTLLLFCLSLAAKDYIPNQFIAVIKEGIERKDIQEKIKDTNIKIQKIFGSKGTYSVKTNSKIQNLHFLKNLEIFSSVEQNFTIKSSKAINKTSISSVSFNKSGGVTPNDPMFHKAWALNSSSPFHIEAQKAWEIRTDSEDIIVAVLDSGVDLNHPDLKANLWVNKKEIPGNGIDDDHNGYVDDVHGIDSHNQTGNPQDKVGHGTLIAGVIGAVGNNNLGGTGILWKTKIMAISGENGTGVMSFEGVIRGGYYAAAMGAKVINGSWGTYTPVASVKKMIEEIAGYGAILVNAVGNNTNDIDRRHLVEMRLKFLGII